MCLICCQLLPLHVGIVLWKVTIQPHSHFSLSINTNLAFLYFKVMQMVIQFMVSFESTKRNIQILRKRNISNIAKPSFDVLNIHLSWVSLRAELLAMLFFDVFCSNDIGLLKSPSKSLQVEFIVFLIWEKQLVLVNSFRRVIYIVLFLVFIYFRKSSEVPVYCLVTGINWSFLPLFEVDYRDLWI